jgi:thrombospondin type 3 repeat protein
VAMRWLAIPTLAAMGCSFELPGPDNGPFTGGDRDGDGIADADDNCPDVANADQHDWDGDRFGDACDGCPHLASVTDPDSDGDGVGDACDPQPGVHDTRILWLGFFDAGELAAWRHSNNAGAWAVTAGALEQTDAAPQLALLDAPSDHGDVAFATRIEVTRALTSPQTELGFCGGNQPVGLQYYCCAINGGGVRAASYWNGAGTPLGMGKNWPGTLAVGDAVDVRGVVTATASECSFTQGGVTVTTQTPRGPPSHGSPVFYTGFAAGRYRYLFVVELGSEAAAGS